MPNVTSSEVEQAKLALQDENAKRRANSNMMYWLAQEGKRDNYDSMTPSDRKAFALAWYANSAKEGTMTKSSKRKFGITKKEVDIGKWMCKKEIVDKFGETKGRSKINMLDAMADRHRPDKDTGEDGEWHREYKIFEDEEEATNYESVDHELASSKDLDGEAERAEALENIASTNLLDKGTKLATPTDASSGVTFGASTVKVEGQKPDEDLKTFNKVKSNPKAVLRTIQDNITELKKMFEVAQDPSRIKYTETLRNEITKTLPRLKQDYTAVEKIHLKSGSSTCIPDPEILAPARTSL
jgi:hypothetical protein